MSSMTPAQKVAAYIKLRDFKKAAEAAFKKSLERPQEAMDKLEAELLADLNASGANSLACDSGTVYRNMQMSATVENRDAFRNFVLQSNLWDAVDLKANKTFVREYMEEQKQEIPGLKVTQIATVGIRRS
jgi:hypothetical protein